IYAEALAAEAAHDGAVDHGAPKFIRVDIVRLQIDARSGEIAHKPARETVARARWIENVVEQITGHHEMLVRMPENRAVLAALDHKNARAHAHDLRRRLAQIPLSRQHPRFRIVDEQEIPFGDRLEQFVAEVCD